MLFNPDPHKSDQEVLFSKKKESMIHPVLSFNNIQKEKKQKRLIKNILV